MYTVSQKHLINFSAMWPSNSCDDLLTEVQSSTKALPASGRKAMYHWVLCKAIDGFVDFRPSGEEMENMAAAGNMTLQQVINTSCISLQEKIVEIKKYRPLPPHFPTTSTVARYDGMTSQRLSML